MDIQQIRYFLAVARYESFSKAAQKLFVTQPILTRCVKNLEQELGLPLIVRTTRSFALTDAGQTLAEYGSRLVQQQEDLCRRMEDLKQVRSGQLRLSSPGPLLDLYFPKLVTGYHALHPGIRIHIRESGSRPVAQDVLDGSADMGVVMLPLEDAENLHVFPILTDAVHAVVPKNHPFAGETAIPIGKLRDVELITYGKSTTLYHTFLRLCRDEGFSPAIAYQSLMPNFILDTIALGSCVGVLPRPMVDLGTNRDLVSIPILPHFPWEIALITARDRYLSCAAADFLAYAKAFFAAEALAPQDQT